MHAGPSGEAFPFRRPTAEHSQEEHTVSDFGSVAASRQPSHSLDAMTHLAHLSAVPERVTRDAPPMLRHVRPPLAS